METRTNKTEQAARLEYLAAVEAYEMEKAMRGAPSRETWDRVAAARAELHRRGITYSI